MLFFSVNNYIIVRLKIIHCWRTKEINVSITAL